jgi:epoxide hydrolase-like predicted phosphatase
MAVISNSFVGAREREEERYGFGKLTDLMIYSHEVGFSKPDPRIYTLCLEQLGLEPDEIVFLDDSEITVAGARAMGMRGVVYERNRQAMKDLDKILDR